ncbi:MAG: BrnA antitoxin family protein [Coriobacteriia bacterium]|nr:BrnA antitoxin family protein [Coriobacteriia bacterium]
MRAEYDFTDSRSNPYSKSLKRQITIRIEESAIDYFKQLADTTGIPYQTLINLYLTDCATNKKKPSLTWE